MTGYRSSDLRWKCPHDGCYIEQLPDWDWMKGCFPRGIMPTDLDGVVEINGHVLYIEQKGCGGSVKEGSGQARLLRVLSKHPDAIVWLIRETHDPQVFECLYREGGTASGWNPYTVEQMQLWLTTWATSADSTSRAGAA